MDFATLAFFAAALSASALFGGMIFFPTVVAPKVFATLDAEAAGRFLRNLFPAYYAFLIIAGAVCAFALMALSSPWAWAAWAIAASALGVRALLVPRINAWRDADLVGEAGAKAKFDAGHRASVLINFVQLGLASALVYVLITG